MSDGDRGGFASSKHSSEFGDSFEMKVRHY
jgi:hypothetical protein